MDPVLHLKHILSHYPTQESIDKAFLILRDLGDKRDNIGLDFDKLADWVGTKDGYKTPKSWFTPIKYRTFYDWFLRSLTPSVRVMCRREAESSRICSPAECRIRYQGHIGDGQIQLKQGPANILDSLRELNPEIGNYRFLKCELLKCFYHRVHSPVDGILSRIRTYTSEDKPFGDNSLTLFEFLVGKDSVYLCMIGEQLIQGVKVSAKEGQRVKKVDPIGNFQWGSMLLLVYPEIWPAPTATKDLFVGSCLVEK